METRISEEVLIIKQPSITLQRTHTHKDQIKNNGEHHYNHGSRGRSIGSSRGGHNGGTIKLLEERARDEALIAD